MNTEMIYNETPEERSSGEPKFQIETDVVGNQKVTLAFGLDEINDKVTAYPDGYNYKYQAAAAANVVVKASPGYLKGIIIGGVGVADGKIEVSDHASDGNGNIVIRLEGGDGTDDLFEELLTQKTGGYVPVECYFATGICADITNQTHVTFIYR
jgi:hypothetical protein